MRTAALLPTALGAWLLVFSAEEATPAQPKAGTTLAFVACPIVRNTQVPCWLAPYRGELYFIAAQGGAASDVLVPQLNHQALIEGVVTDETICGGRVLRPVKASVLPELDRTCNAIIPAEGYASPEPQGRTPEPMPLPANVTGRPKPITFEPPYIRRAFTVEFDFDWDRTWVGNRTRPGFTPIESAANYAVASKARRVEVVGYRGTAKLSDGQRMDERSDIAARRAQKLTQALIDLGVPQQTLVTRSQDAVTGEGIASRRAVITVTPLN
jgi:hypothetical protein